MLRGVSFWGSLPFQMKWSNWIKQNEKVFQRRAFCYRSNRKAWLVPSNECEVSKSIMNLYTWNKRISSINNSNNNNSNIHNIEEDPFFVNPLRKLICVGCGEFLQCTKENKSGFVPASVYEKYSNGRMKTYTKIKGQEVESVPDGIQVDVNNGPHFRMKTKLILCKRCYRLQNYKKLDGTCEVDQQRIEQIKKYRKEIIKNLEDTQRGKKKIMNHTNSNTIDNKNNNNVDEEVQNNEEDSSHLLEKRYINIYEKKEIMKKRKEGKKMDLEKMELSTAKYIEADRNHLMNMIIKKMKKKSLVLYIIDITNIENTILPELYIGCKNKDVNIIWLVNKVDCLPKFVNLDNVKVWFRNLIRQIKNSHINDLIFISSLKFYNFAMLEERMKYYVNLEEGTDIYIVGCVNVGKSTFVNAFLKYINYKHIGDIYNKRKKGGVTASNIPYTTLNFNFFKLKKNIQLIDTMGIPAKYQYASILYRDIDINSISINKRIQPFTYKLKEDSSIILGSLGYINLVYGDFCLLTFYISNKVTIHMCKKEKTQSFIEQKKCSFLYPPHVKEDFELLHPFVKHTIKLYGRDFESLDDIVLSDLGWFSLSGKGMKIIEVFVPKYVKVYRRPSMITDAVKHTQIDIFKFKSFRGRTNKVLRRKKKLIEELNNADPNRREFIKQITLKEEQKLLDKLKTKDNEESTSEKYKNLQKTDTPSNPSIYNPQDLKNVEHYL